MSASPHRPDLNNVASLFDRFDSEDLRRLDIFVQTVAKVGRFKLFGIADQLGRAPRIEIHRHAEKGRRGEGTIHTQVANPDVREAAWPALRKLRTPANPCSTSATRKLLHRRAAAAERLAPDLPHVCDMVIWLKAFGKALSSLESSDAVVGGTVRDKDGTERPYRSRKQVLDLAQNAETFHDDLDKRADFELIRPLLEPAIDQALIAHARMAFELADVAEAVLAEPALLRR